MRDSINPKKQARRVIGLARRTHFKVKKHLSIAKHYNFSIDSPRKAGVEKRHLTVEGWIIPRDGRAFEIRIRNNGIIHKVKKGLKRLDVSKSHPEYDKEKALYSGFSSEFEFEDGTLTLEVSTGGPFKKLWSTKIYLSTGILPRDLYNKDLSNNYPEHVNLMINRQSFYYEDRLDASFERHPDDPRLMAIYLPQFHPFAENEKAWGRGFTEWSNVTAAQPRFVGHQQPILPKDLGFYDLRFEGKIKEQIDLAKKYGIYGFAFYYYWFSGKKVMEKPLETFLKHKEWDFNFSICWANENWTKRWDGRDSDVIIAQEYLEDDPIHFIKDVEDILLDPRYITEDGKPVLTVYRASELKDPRRYATIWREYFRKTHNKELQLVSCLSFDDQDPREYGFDIALDFAPLSAFFKNKFFPHSQFPYVDVRQKLLDVNFSGIVAEYRAIALNGRLDDAFEFPTYPCVAPSWDNDARKKGKGFVYQNSSPDAYAAWLERIVERETSRKKAPLIYINAWNEWAEGAIMEPTTHFGHAVLNRTVEVMSRHSKQKANLKNFPAYGLKKQSKKKLAVVVHLFYPDVWPKIADKLALIEEPYDLFVTLDKKDAEFSPTLPDKNVVITTFVTPNRGRDVLPFLYVARRLRAAGYDYVLKIHSKKSKHRKDGSVWLDDVLKGLLPGREQIRDITALLEDKKGAIVGPANHRVSLKRHMGSNYTALEDLLRRIYDEKTARETLAQAEYYSYIGGTMFWLRLEIIDMLLDLQLMPDDFQSEQGQIDGTMAHAIERLFGILAKKEGGGIYLSNGTSLEPISNEPYDKKYDFAP